MAKVFHSLVQIKLRQKHVSLLLLSENQKSFIKWNLVVSFLAATAVGGRTGGPGDGVVKFLRP